MTYYCQLRQMIIYTTILTIITIVIGLCGAEDHHVSFTTFTYENTDNNNNNTCHYQSPLASICYTTHVTYSVITPSNHAESIIKLTPIISDGQKGQIGSPIGHTPSDELTITPCSETLDSATVLVTMAGSVPVGTPTNYISTASEVKGTEADLNGVSDSEIRLHFSSLGTDHSDTPTTSEPTVTQPSLSIPYGPLCRNGGTGGEVTQINAAYEAEVDCEQPFTAHQTQEPTTAPSTYESRSRTGLYSLWLREDCTGVNTQNWEAFPRRENEISLIGADTVTYPRQIRVSIDENIDIRFVILPFYKLVTESATILNINSEGTFILTNLTVHIFGGDIALQINNACDVGIHMPMIEINFSNHSTEFADAMDEVFTNSECLSIRLPKPSDEAILFFNGVSWPFEYGFIANLDNVAPVIYEFELMIAHNYMTWFVDAVLLFYNHSMFGLSHTFSEPILETDAVKSKQECPFGIRFEWNDCDQNGWTATEALRNWDFAGSNDGSNWLLINNNANDESLRSAITIAAPTADEKSQNSRPYNYNFTKAHHSTVFSQPIIKVVMVGGWIKRCIYDLTHVHNYSLQFRIFIDLKIQISLCALATFVVFCGFGLLTFMSVLFTLGTIFVWIRSVFYASVDSIRASIVFAWNHLFAHESLDVPFAPQKHKKRQKKRQKKKRNRGKTKSIKRYSRSRSRSMSPERGRRWSRYLSKFVFQSIVADVLSIHLFALIDAVFSSVDVLSIFAFDGLQAFYFLILAVLAVAGYCGAKNLDRTCLFMNAMCLGLAILARPCMIYLDTSNIINIILLSLMIFIDLFVAKRVNVLRLFNGVIRRKQQTLMLNGKKFKFDRDFWSIATKPTGYSWDIEALSNLECSEVDRAAVLRNLDLNRLPQIYVDSLKLDGEPNGMESVKSIKLKIRDKKGIPCEMQRLYARGKILNDETVLSYNNDDILHLRLIITGDGGRGWNCGQCTFLNLACANRCAMCTGPKPQCSSPTPHQNVFNRDLKQSKAKREDVSAETVQGVDDHRKRVDEQQSLESIYNVIPCTSFYFSDKHGKRSKNYASMCCLGVGADYSVSFLTALHNLWGWTYKCRQCGRETVRCDKECKQCKTKYDEFERVFFDEVRLEFTHIDSDNYGKPVNGASFTSDVNELKLWTVDMDTQFVDPLSGADMVIIKMRNKGLHERMSGWFAHGNISLGVASHFLNLCFSIFGYPYDQRVAIDGLRKRQLLGMKSSAENNWDQFMVDNRSKLAYLEHDVDTSGGQSGSPLFVCVGDGQNREYRVVAVHIAGARAVNIATSITQESKFEMEKFIEKRFDETPTAVNKSKQAIVSPQHSNVASTRKKRSRAGDDEDEDYDITMDQSQPTQPTNSHNTNGNRVNGNTNDNYNHSDSQHNYGYNHNPNNAHLNPQNTSLPPHPREWYMSGQHVGVNVGYGYGYGEPAPRMHYGNGDTHRHSNTMQIESKNESVNAVQHVTTKNESESDPNSNNVKKEWSHKQNTSHSRHKKRKRHRNASMEVTSLEPPKRRQRTNNTHKRIFEGESDEDTNDDYWNGMPKSAVSGAVDSVNIEDAEEKQTMRKKWKGHVCQPLFVRESTRLKKTCSLLVNITNEIGKKMDEELGLPCDGQQFQYKMENIGKYVGYALGKKFNDEKHKNVSFVEYKKKMEQHVLNQRRNVFFTEPTKDKCVYKIWLDKVEIYVKAAAEIRFQNQKNKEAYIAAFKYDFIHKCFSEERIVMPRGNSTVFAKTWARRAGGRQVIAAFLNETDKIKTFKDLLTICEEKHTIAKLNITFV